MLSLDRPQTGTLGAPSFVSDLFIAAVTAKFSGGILIKAPEDAAIFFRDGSPIHAAGPALRDFPIGELLVSRGVISAEALESALQTQNECPPTDRPFLGAILVRDAGVPDEAIIKAVEEQIVQRVTKWFSVTTGTFQAAPGDNSRIKEIAVAADGTQLLWQALKNGASDLELRSISDMLLGKAVGVSELHRLPPFAFDETERRLLKLLEKPRKPDQLERSIGNRRLARALLRLLFLYDCLQIDSAKKAIPIPGTVRIAPQPSLTTLDVTDESQVRASQDVIIIEPPPPPKKDQPKRRSAEEQKLIKEIQNLHKDIGNKSHFELLGVKDSTTPVDLRKSFTQLAKKFHPDALSPDVDEKTAHMARELSAAMNEAYQTLSNDESRAKYLALLSDERVKGDARKAERIRDAEVKHQMGMVMLKKKDYQTAREYLNFAAEGDPQNALYRANFAWSIFADSKFNRDQAYTKAHDLLTEALELSKDVLAIAHFYMGQVLKSKGNVGDAAEHFRKAFKLDPKNTDAEREIRLMEKRATKSGDEGSGRLGGLGKLFKRQRSDSE